MERLFIICLFLRVTVCGVCCCSPEWSLITRRDFHQYMRKPFHRKSFHIFLSGPVLLLWSSTFFALFDHHLHVLGDCVKLPGNFLFENRFFYLHYEILCFVFTTKRQEVSRENPPSVLASDMQMPFWMKRKNCDCPWTSFTGKHWKWREKLQRQTPAEKELCKWNGNFCSNWLERKEWREQYLIDSQVNPCTCTCSSQHETFCTPTATTRLPKANWKDDRDFTIRWRDGSENVG